MGRKPTDWKSTRRFGENSRSSAWGVLLGAGLGALLGARLGALFTARFWAALLVGGVLVSVVGGAGCTEMKARRKLKRGRYSEALRLLNKDTKIHPMLKARALAGLTRYEEAYASAMIEVKRLSRRSRGPVKPFLFAARLAHRLDRTQECLELLEMARKRGALPRSHKIIEGLRRVDRARAFLRLGAARQPLLDLQRAEALFVKLGILDKSGRLLQEGLDDKKSSSQKKNAGQKKFRVGKQGLSRLTDFRALQARAREVSAAWAWARGKKERAKKLLAPLKNKSPGSVVRSLVKGRGLQPKEALAAAGLFQRLGALEAVLTVARGQKTAKTKNASEAVMGAQLELWMKGLEAARATWDRKGAWALSRRLGRWAARLPHQGQYGALEKQAAPWAELRLRAGAALAKACRAWQDMGAPACQELGRLVAKGLKKPAATAGAKPLKTFRAKARRRWRRLWGQWLATMRAWSVEGDSLGLTPQEGRRLWQGSSPFERVSLVQVMALQGASPKHIERFLGSAVAKGHALRLDGKKKAAWAAARSALGKTGGGNSSEAKKKARLDLALLALELGWPQKALAALGPAGERPGDGAAFRLRWLALTAKGGRVSLFRYLQKQAQRDVRQPLPLATLRRRLAAARDALVGPGHLPVGLVWLEEVKKSLGKTQHQPGSSSEENDGAKPKNRAKPKNKAKPKKRAKAPSEAEQKDVAKAQHRRRALVSAVLDDLAKPLQEGLEAWVQRLGEEGVGLGSPRGARHGSIVSLWKRWVPKGSARQALTRFIQQARTRGHKKTSGARSAQASRTATKKTERVVGAVELGILCLRLAALRQAEKAKKSSKPGGSKSENPKPENPKPENPKPENPKPDPPQQAQALQAARATAKKLLQATEAAAQKERATTPGELGPTSLTLWRARLLFILGQAKKARGELTAALRTGPLGVGLGRLASVLEALEELGLDPQEHAHRVASAFPHEAALLGLAARSLVRSPNQGWATLAGQDLLAASPDRGRASLLLSKRHLAAGRCGRAGRRGLEVYEWVSPRLPDHALAVAHTVRLLGLCQEEVRLRLQLQNWWGPSTKAQRRTGHLRETRQARWVSRVAVEALREAGKPCLSLGVVREWLAWVGRERFGDAGWGWGAPLVEAARACGDLRSAQKLAGQEVGKNPTSPEAHCRLAAVEAAQGERRRALRRVRRALALWEAGDGEGRLGTRASGGACAVGLLVEWALEEEGERQERGESQEQGERRKEHEGPPTDREKSGRGVRALAHARAWLEWLRVVAPQWGGAARKGVKKWAVEKLVGLYTRGEVRTSALQRLLDERSQQGETGAELKALWKNIQRRMKGLSAQ